MSCSLISLVSQTLKQLEVARRCAQSKGLNARRSKGYPGNVDLAVRVAIVSSFGQYFGQVAPFGLSSSSCAHSCLLSQFEQQKSNSGRRPRRRSDRTLKLPTLAPERCYSRSVRKVSTVQQTRA